MLVDFRDDRGTSDILTEPAEPILPCVLLIDTSGAMKKVEKQLLEIFIKFVEGLERGGKSSSRPLCSYIQ